MRAVKPTLEAPQSGTAHTLPPKTLRELERLDRLAYWLDAAFRVPGTRWRFGLDAIIGLLPGIGDLAGVALSLYLIGRASRLGVPATTLAKMLFNAGLELVLGALPLIGDLFDAWYKANQRNIELLRKALHTADRQKP